MAALHTEGLLFSLEAMHKSSLLRRQCGLSEAVRRSVPRNVPSEDRLESKRFSVFHGKR